jgi:hypothetical protein
VTQQQSWSCEAAAAAAAAAATVIARPPCLTVTWGEPRSALRHDPPEHVFGFTPRQATDGISRGVASHQLLHADIPELDIKPALHHHRGQGQQGQP